MAQEISEKKAYTYQCLHGNNSTYLMSSFDLITHEMLAAGFESNTSHVNVKLSFGLNATESPSLIFTDLGVTFESMEKINVCKISILPNQNTLF